MVLKTSNTLSFSLFPRFGFGLGHPKQHDSSPSHSQHPHGANANTTGNNHDVEYIPYTGPYEAPKDHLPTNAEQHTSGNPSHPEQDEDAVEAIMADPDMLIRYGSGYTAAARKGNAAITVPGTRGPNACTSGDPSTSTSGGPTTNTSGGPSTGTSGKNTSTGTSAGLAARSMSSSSSAVDPSRARRSHQPNAPRPQLPSFATNHPYSSNSNSGGVGDSPMPTQRTRSQKRTSRSNTAPSEGGSLMRSRSGSEGTGGGKFLAIGPSSGSGSGSASSRRPQHPGKMALDIPTSSSSAISGPRTAPALDDRSPNITRRPSLSSSHVDIAPARKSSVEGAKGGYFFDADAHYPNHTYTRFNPGTGSPRRAPSVPLLNRDDDRNYNAPAQTSRGRAQSSSAHRPTLSDNVLMGYTVPSSSHHTPPPPSAQAQAQPQSQAQSHPQSQAICMSSQHQDTLPPLVSRDYASSASDPSSGGTQNSASAAHGHVLHPYPNPNFNPNFNPDPHLHPYATATSPMTSPRRAPVALPQRDSGSFLGHHRQQGSGSSASMSQMSQLSQKALGKRPSGLGLSQGQGQAQRISQGNMRAHTRDASGSSAVSSQQQHPQHLQPPARTQSVLKKRPPRTTSHARTHSHSRVPSNVSSSAYSQGSHASGLGSTSSTHGHGHGRGHGQAQAAAHPVTASTLRVPSSSHPPGQNPLRASLSAPNLGEANRAFLVPPNHNADLPSADRRKSRGLPKGLDRWLSAESWCDAIFLPKPRFRLKSSMSAEGMREKAAGYGKGQGQDKDAGTEGRRSRKSSQARIVSPPATPVKGWNPPMPPVPAGTMGRTRSASAGAASALGLGLGPPPGPSSYHAQNQRTVSQGTQAHPSSSASSRARGGFGFGLGLMKSRSVADLGADSNNNDYGNGSSRNVHKYLSVGGPGTGRHAHTFPARPALSPIASVQEHSGAGSSVLLQAIFNDPVASSNVGGEGSGDGTGGSGSGALRPRSRSESVPVQDDMVLPTPVPTLSQVIEEGEELERQRQKWQKQARSSLGNKHTRSISRARTKSLSEAQAKRQGLADRDQDEKKHNKHLDFLAQRTFLGKQFDAPSVTVTGPHGTSVNSLVRMRSRGTGTGSGAGAGTGSAHTRSQTTWTGTSHTGTVPSSHAHTQSHATTSAGSHHHSRSHSHSHSSPGSKRGSWSKNTLLKASALCAGPEQDDVFSSPMHEDEDSLDITAREGAGVGIDVGEGWVDLGHSDTQHHHNHPRLEPRPPTLSRSRSVSQPLPNGHANANSLGVADPSPETSTRGSAIGIALSTPPPSDDGHYTASGLGAEPFKFPSHPYAAITSSNGHPHGAPPVNHHGLSDEAPKRHSAKRSEYVGPHPTLFTAQIDPSSATSYVSMRHRLPPGAVQHQQQQAYVHPFASALPCPGTAAGVNYNMSTGDGAGSSVRMSLSNLDLDRMGVGAMLAYAERERTSPLPTPPLPSSHPLMQRMQAQMQHHAHARPQVQEQSHARTFTQGAMLPNPHDDRVQYHHVEEEEPSPKEGRFLENFSADGHMPSSDGHGRGASPNGNSQPFLPPSHYIVDQAMPVFAQVQPLVPRHHPSGSASWSGATNGHGSNRGSGVHPAIPLERQSSAQRVITMLENDDDLDEFRDLFYNPPSASLVPAPSAFELQDPPQPRVHLPVPTYSRAGVEAAQRRTQAHRRKLSEVAEAESIGSSSSALTNLVHKLSAEMLSLRADDSPRMYNSSPRINNGSPSSLRLRHNASQERLSEKNFVFTDLTASYSALPVVLGGTSSSPLQDAVAAEHMELAGGEGGVPEDVASSRASSPFEGPEDAENDTFGFPIRRRHFQPPSLVPVLNIPSQDSSSHSILVGSADEDPPHTPEREALNSATSPSSSTDPSLGLGAALGTRRLKRSSRDPAIRASCMTVTSDTSCFSGLSDFPAPPHQAELTPAHMSILQGYFDATPGASSKQVEDPLAQALGRMSRPGMSRTATSEATLSPRYVLPHSGTAENAATTSFAPSSAHPTTQAPRPAL